MICFDLGLVLAEILLIKSVKFIFWFSIYTVSELFASAHRLCIAFASKDHTVARKNIANALKPIRHCAILSKLNLSQLP